MHSISNKTHSLLGTILYVITLLMDIWFSINNAIFKTENHFIQGLYVVHLKVYLYRKKYDKYVSTV